MLTLSSSQEQALRSLQRSTRERCVYVRVTTVLMLHQGFAASDVGLALGIDESSVYRYGKAYPKAGSLGEFVTRQYVGYTGRLTADQAQAVVAYVGEELRLTASGVADWVRTALGVSYSAGGMVGVLHRLGFAYKYTHLVPSKADSAQQQEFLDHVLLPLLAQAAPGAGAEAGAEVAGEIAGEIAGEAVSEAAPLVYFADAVHPQHNTRPERGWIAVGETFPISSNSGRKRLTITAAVNAHQVCDVVTHESGRANGEATIALLEALRTQRDEKSPGRPIVVVCDNASTWRAKCVTDWLAERPDCRLCFLPPYSPNLNLIERLWKHLRKEVISSFYTPSFAVFAERIRNLFRNIAEHKNALQSLLTLKFAVV
jgi:transposase